MKEIIVIKRSGDRIEILVDDEDYEELNKYKWSVQNSDLKVYARRKTTIKEREEGLPGSIYMHRQIMNITDSKIEIDHRNGNGLDNQRYNLRVATSSQNSMNCSKRQNATSKYKGVAWYKNYSKWEVTVQIKGKKYKLGYFENEEEAAKAYNSKAKELFGEYACLNKIDHT